MAEAERFHNLDATDIMTIKNEGSGVTETTVSNRIQTQIQTLFFTKNSS